MEEAQYWTWRKRKSNFMSSYGYSWEEQAFAEDTAGLLGGCVWPPRSYSCSFCRREFKSAQALGGHMNVHRRDRARLKQCNPTTTTTTQDNDNNNEFIHASQVCTLGYNPSSDSDYHAFLESPSSLSRASPPSTIINLNCDESTFLHPSVHMLDDKSILNKVNGAYGDLSVSLNLVICQTQLPTVSASEESESLILKRRRIDSAVSFFPETVLEDIAESKVIELINPNSLEEIDLELRLGNQHI